MYRNIGIFLLPALAITSFAQRNISVSAPSNAPATRLAVARKLTDEAASRSKAHWSLASIASSTSDSVILTTAHDVDSALPSALRAEWQRATRTIAQEHKPEGYTIVPLRHGHVLVIAGQDEAGILFGAGWLLRNLPESGLPQTKPFFSAPDKPVRGYQIGYRMKNNTYDAWTLQQFEQQMWDLAVFGMNTVQVVAPNSDDDRSSPLFHASAEDVVIGLSALSQKYGLRFDLYYPEMAKNYADPAQVNAELVQFEALVKRLPRVDSLHVPGGDPGHTEPSLLFPLLEQQAKILRKYHPKADVWVSGQGFTAERFASFYTLLQQQPSWLTGVFFGPQSRDGMPEERAHIPTKYPLEFYPDIGHAMHAQFPVPQWDPIFALTEGREPICPRPQEFTHIYRHFADENTGFMVYSEGVNDDVNKVLWSSLGWNRDTDTRTILNDYARYFFHAGNNAAKYANAISGLESNWSSQLLANTSTIASTHSLFRSLPDAGATNWRWHSLQYRDAYDRYLQIKRLREKQSEEAALRALRSSGTVDERITNARAALDQSTPGTEEHTLHDQLETLAGKLFAEVGLQLSVPKYGASNWERGANLDRIDTPLNDRTWLEAEFKKIQQLSSEEAKRNQLARIANWQAVPPGSFYDDLGDPANEPHLVRGTPWQDDPEMYHAAIDGIADQTLEHGWRLSWLSYGETLYETPLTLHYANLDRSSNYTLKVTYAGEDYVLPMQVEANGTVVQPFRTRNGNPEEVELKLPHALTQDGALTVQWKRAPGVGGGGRGGQVAEVWLLPDTDHKQ